MINTRKFVAFAISAMIIASTSVTAFAATTTTPVTCPNNYNCSVTDCVGGGACTGYNCGTANCTVEGIHRHNSAGKSIKGTVGGTATTYGHHGRGMGGGPRGGHCR